MGNGKLFPVKWEKLFMLTKHIHLVHYINKSNSLDHRYADDCAFASVLSNRSVIFCNLYFLCRDMLRWFSTDYIYCAVCYVKSYLYTVNTILMQCILDLLLLTVFVDICLFACRVGRSHKFSQHGPKPAKIIPFKIIRHISRVCCAKWLLIFCSHVLLDPLFMKIAINNVC